MGYLFIPLDLVLALPEGDDDPRGGYFSERNDNVSETASCARPEYVFNL